MQMDICLEILAHEKCTAVPLCRSASKAEMHIRTHHTALQRRDCMLTLFFIDVVYSVRGMTTSMLL